MIQFPECGVLRGIKSFCRGAKRLAIQKINIYYKKEG